MDGWKYWYGKKVYIILKNKRQYQGVVLEIESDIKKFWSIFYNYQR